MSKEGDKNFETIQFNQELSDEAFVENFSILVDGISEVEVFSELGSTLKQAVERIENLIEKNTELEEKLRVSAENQVKLEKIVVGVEEKVGGKKERKDEVVVESSSGIDSVNNEQLSKNTSFQDLKEVETTPKEVERREKLKPEKIKLFHEVSGKHLSLGNASDFLVRNSDDEKTGYHFDAKHKSINHIMSNSREIKDTTLRLNGEIDRNNPPSAFYVDWESKSGRGLNVVHIQGLKENFGTPEGQSARLYRNYIHKELFHLQDGSKTIELLKEGYAVFPHLIVARERYNFTEPLKPKAVTFEEASETTIEGRSGNFWSDQNLSSEEFLPVIAKTLSLINQNKNVLLSALHPVTREPIDTHSKILFFQLIQQLLLAKSDKLISFVSSPLFYFGNKNLTFREPGERTPERDSRYPYMEVDTKEIRLTKNEQKITEELKRLFLGDIPWLDAHKEWLEEVGSKLLSEEV